MIEFFEKNLGFLILVTIVGSFVIWSVRKENKEKEKKQKDSKDKKEGEQNNG